MGVQRTQRIEHGRATTIGIMIPTDEQLQHLAGQVADRLHAGGRTLVTAESCTSGWIAKLCTDRPGSSAWFRGGAVVYDDELKVTLLGFCDARGTRSSERADRARNGGRRPGLAPGAR